MCPTSDPPGPMTAEVEFIDSYRTKVDPLEAFLAGVEKRAFRTALLTTRKTADALDIVQEAMLKLVQNYRTRSAAEWPLLFQRILQNTLMDWHREQSRQRRWFWQAPASRETDEESTEEDYAGEPEENPAEIMARARHIEVVMAALEKLPLRQRQAFLLRTWEGFDTAATARVMECSEGSVKTHFFRAVQTLKNLLENGEDRF